MDTDQLISALTQHAADPANVRAGYERKRRRAARRRYAALGAATAVVLGAGAVTAARSLTSAPQHTTAATASACRNFPLQKRLTIALQQGQSVIVAYGKLTGYNVLTSGGDYNAMRLRDVKTLTGPPLKQNTVWLTEVTGPDGPVDESEDTGPLWSTDGRLFATVWEGTIAANSIDGPILQVAPIVNGQVIFSTGDCWNPAGLHARPYHGPLAQIPGSRSYQGAEAAGFWAVPLSTVEAITASAEKAAAGNG